MAKTSLYLPDALAEEVRRRGVSVSAVCQAALRAELSSRGGGPQPEPPRFRLRVIGRGAEEVYDVPAVPRIGELVSGRSFAAARVTDVRHGLAGGEITLFVQ